MYHTELIWKSAEYEAPPSIQVKDFCPKPCN